MSSERHITAIHTGSSRAAWTAVAIIVSVLGLVGFYVMQTGGFSGDTDRISVELNAPSAVPANQ